MEENKLIEQYQQGINQKEIITIFYKQYKDMIYKIANKFLYIEVEDAAQNLYFCLPNCLNKFDINSGNKFSTYFYHALENALRIYIRDRKVYLNRYGIEASLDEVYSNKDGGCSKTQIYQVGECDKYSYENEIDERYYYGLNQFQIKVIKDLLDGKTQQEISEEYGVTQACISKNISKIRSIVNFNIKKIQNGYEPPTYVVDDEFIPVSMRSQIDKHKDERIGETFTNTLGDIATIIDYDGSDKVSIQFEDGTILTNQQYRTIKFGGFRNPSKHKSNVSKDKIIKGV